MATEVLMPQLGESVTEGTIAKWLVKPGDKVKKYEPLCEVTTDKVNAEVPSTIEGTVTELVAEEGDTLAVGGLICYIDAEGGAAEAPQAAQPAPTQETVSEMPAAESPKTPPASAPKQSDAAAVKAAGKRYSPAVLRLAQENDIDLAQITGTGKEGRITRKDVLAFIEQGGAAAQPAMAAPSVQERKRNQPSLLYRRKLWLRRHLRQACVRRAAHRTCPAIRAIQKFRYKYPENDRQPHGAEQARSTACLDDG